MKLVPPHKVLPYFYRCVTVAIEYYDGWCPCLKTPGSVAPAHTREAELSHEAPLLSLPESGKPAMRAAVKLAMHSASVNPDLQGLSTVLPNGYLPYLQNVEQPRQRHPMIYLALQRSRDQLMRQEDNLPSFDRAGLNASRVITNFRIFRCEAQHQNDFIRTNLWL